MDIYDELDRIRGQGFNVIIKWDEFIVFSRVPTSKEEGYLKKVHRTENEQWKHCIYRAIIDFDEGLI